MNVQYYVPIHFTIKHDYCTAFSQFHVFVLLPRVDFSNSQLPFHQ